MAEKTNGRQPVLFGNGGELKFRAKEVGKNGNGGYVIVAVQNGVADIVAEAEKVIVKDKTGRAFSAGQFCAVFNGEKITARTMAEVMSKIAAKLTPAK